MDELGWLPDAVGSATNAEFDYSDLLEKDASEVKNGSSG
jgi:hypothetical protein